MLVAALWALRPVALGGARRLTDPTPRGYGQTGVSDVTCPPGQEVKTNETFTCSLLINGQQKTVLTTDDFLAGSAVATTVPVDRLPRWDTADDCFHRFQPDSSNLARGAGCDRRCLDARCCEARTPQVREILARVSQGQCGPLTPIEQVRPLRNLDRSPVRKRSPILLRYLLCASSRSISHRRQRRQLLHSERLMASRSSIEACLRNWALSSGDGWSERAYPEGCLRQRKLGSGR